MRVRLAASELGLGCVSNSRQDFFLFVVSWLRGSHEFSCHRPFPPNRLCRGQTGKGRAEKCPEIPFAGIRRCQGRASRRACMLRPHPRPDRHARLQPSGRPDVGARGLLARDPVASAVRPAGAGRRGSGPGAEPARAVRRGEGAVGHADARAARRGRPPRPAPLRSGGVHAALQRGKALEGRTASGGRLPVAADGTGRRSSRKAVCRRRPRQDPPRRVEDLLPSGTGRGDRPSRPRRGVPAGPGAGPERGRQEEERLRAERLEAARRGPPPGASAHGRAAGAGDGPAAGGPHVMLRERRRASARPGREAGRPRAAVRLVRCQRDEGDMGEARREDRHRAPLRTGPRPAGRRRELRPEDRHARMRGDRHEREGPEVLAGRRPPARPGHGVSVMRCGRVRGGRPGTRRSGHRDAGGLQLRARLRPWREPPMGRLHDARHARLPDRPVQRHCRPPFGRAREHQERIPCLRDRMREPAGPSSSGTGRPSAARSRGSLARRTMPARPCRAVTAPATPGRPRSRPSPAPPRSRAAARPPVVRTRNCRPP